MNVIFNYDCYLTDTATSDVISRACLTLEGTLDFVPAQGQEFRFSEIWESGDDLSVTVERSFYRYDEETLYVYFDEYVDGDTDQFSMLMTGLTSKGWEVDEDPSDDEFDDEFDELEDDTVV